jgi:hypothetical protein
MSIRNDRKGFDTFVSLVDACRPIFEIIVFRMVLFLRGPLPAKRIAVRVLVAHRRESAGVLDSGVITIRGTVSHPHLPGGSIRVSLETQIVDPPGVRIVGGRFSTGWFEMHGVKNRFMVDTSRSNNLEIRPVRPDGSFGSVRFNRNGPMKVRRSDYD